MNRKGLAIQNLASGYGQKQILHDVSLEVGDRETLVLMGISGSGKTTLLLTILGILRPTSGTIVLNGTNLDSMPLEERNIGYLPQDYGLFPHMNVLENISYGLRMRGVLRAERESVAEEMLKLAELDGLEKKRVQELSGGQKQRVGLARALAIKPNLLLLDEPLSNIDQITKFEVAVKLKDLFRKLDIPILLVTHNHEDALFLSERLAIMMNGRIEQIGTKAEIFSAPKNDTIRRLLSPFAVG